MSRMLPSGRTTELKSPRGDQSAFEVICVHEAPLSCDHQTSLRKLLPVQPPISTILPSGNATLSNRFLACHGAFSFISDHVAPASVERHTSLEPPPIITILPSGISRQLKNARGDHGALAFISVQGPVGVGVGVGVTSAIGYDLYPSVVVVVTVGTGVLTALGPYRSSIATTGNTSTRLTKRSRNFPRIRP